jgi:hypothetical protein
MPSYRQFALLSALTLAACSKDPPKPEPAKEATAVATAAPATTTAAPATSAAPAIAASASAPASAAAPTSPEPSPQEWESAKLDVNAVKNWNRPGCMTRRVREWLRVACSEMTTQQGMPSGIQIVKGFPPSKFNVLTEQAGSIMLVFPATAGLDGEATFTFAKATYRFVARWPAGQPEPKEIGAFEETARRAAEGEPASAEPKEPPIKVELGR